MTDAPEHIRLVPLTNDEMDIILIWAGTMAADYGFDEDEKDLGERLSDLRGGRANPNKLLETPARDGQSMRAWK